MEPLGVGIIGAGMFGRKHAQALADVLEARVVAASARTPERLDAFTDTFGGIGYRDYHDLLGDPTVDAVCITLPHNDHAAASCAAAEAGKAVLIEKPLAPGEADCDAIVTAVDRCGVPFMVGHNYRFVPAYLEARRLIAEGAIGDVTLGLASMVKDWTFDQREPWHLADGGGMWLTNAIHLVDRLSWLFGAEPRDIRAQVGTHFHPQPVDDVGVALITFDSGAVGLVRAIGYRCGAEDRWSELQGSTGAIRVSESGGVQLGRGHRWEEVFPPDADWTLASLRNEWRAFVRYVRDGGPSPVSLAYGRRMVATMAAGLESSATGQTVAVPTGAATSARMP